MSNVVAGSVSHAGPPRAAFLESSPVYRAALSAVAEEEGWSARMHATFPELLASVETTGVELIVLSYKDVLSPDLEFGRLLGMFEGPLVVLADGGGDLKAALRSGATLALLKPFDPEFLLLAIRAVYERTGSLRSMLTSGTNLGDLWVRLANHTVERGGRRQVLGPGEWQLFAFLLANPGKTFSRDDLARGAWGTGYRGRVSQVELYISRVRRKVERNPHRPQVIVTVRGKGYRLMHDDGAQAVPGGSTPGVGHQDRELDAPSYLTAAYREIINVGTRLMERRGDALDAADTHVRSEIRANDLVLIQATIKSAQVRLAHWESFGLGP
jgi:DNA-binding response OmpR family regulator